MKISKINPNAAGGLLRQYKIMQLSDSYQMNTNMTGSRWFTKSVVSLSFRQK